MFRAILVTGLAVLILVLVGCTGGSQAASNTPSTVTAPNSQAASSNNTTANPASNADSADIQSAKARSLAAATSVNSYRFTLTMKIGGKDADGQDASSGIDMQGEETRNPLASHYTTKTLGTGDNSMGDVETYNVGGTTHVKVAGKWTSYQSTFSGTSGFGMFVPSDDVATLVSYAKKVGTEDTNGRSTTHYHFDLAAMKAANAADKGTDSEGNTLNDDWLANATDGQLDVWVDNDDGFLARYEMSGKGTFDQGDKKVDGTITINYQLKDINSNFAVTLPVDAK